MDYQIVPKTQKQHYLLVISLLIIFTLPRYYCIVNRDLVLTPKQGLQLSGKRIFYEEESSSSDNNVSHHNETVAEGAAATVTGTRPWERTLKHVTYLTLFTNAANGIITGNFSKVKEYNDFLASPYVRSPTAIDSRFGDIVTLAQGRLETLPNGYYQFTEGNCDYECARENNIIAMWHVQKIRHRDSADRKYHYEMKFSVSPINAKTPTETVVRGGPNKRTAMEERTNDNVQTFIQKEDDYPHSFRKLAAEADEDFSEKRYDSGRSFRHVSPHYQPQGTFLRGVFQQPPPGVPMSVQQYPNRPPQLHAIRGQAPHNHPQQQLSAIPERLNIGEFYKGNNFAPKSSSKVELFPNLLNMFLGQPPQRVLPPPPAPTTYRPTTLSKYQMKLSRPDIYTLQQHQLLELAKFAEYQQLPLSSQSQEKFNHRASYSAPTVTHHYHHHFFMPNNSAMAIEQAAIQHSGGDPSSVEASVELYHNDVTEMAVRQAHYGTNLYEEPPQSSATFRQHLYPLQAQHHHQQTANQQQNLHPNYYSNYHVQQVVPPAPQKFIFTNTQIEPQRVVHVTPAPPLKKPKHTRQHQQQQQLQQQLQQQQYELHPFTSSLEYTTVHVPLLISYPAPANEETRANLVPNHRQKPFVQSDPIEDATHYSEPDPLYTNTNEEQFNKDKRFLTHAEYGQQAPQLESPDHYDHTNLDSKREHSESVEAQLPPPNNVTHAAADAINTRKKIRQKISQHSDSKAIATIDIPNEKTTAKYIKTEASSSIAVSTHRPKIATLRNKQRISLKTATTTSSTSTTTSKPTTNPTVKSSPTSTLKASTISKPRKAFVSTSSTEPPLRTISRYRNSYARTSSTTSTSTTTTTTATEKPVLKWTPKKQNSHSKFKLTTTSSKPIVKAKKENEADDTDTPGKSDINAAFKAKASNHLRKPKSSKFDSTTTSSKLIIGKDTEEDELEGTVSSEDSNENEDFKANESNNLGKTKPSLFESTTASSNPIIDKDTEEDELIETNSSSEDIKDFKTNEGNNLVKTQSSQFESTTTTSSNPIIDKNIEEDELIETNSSEDIDENEDFTANESNNLRKRKSSSLLSTMSADDDEAVQTTMETTTSPTLTTTLSSSLFPLATEFYEILTQKSVSKSVSLKVGSNGEEIPIIVDDEENEVKTV